MTAINSEPGARMKYRLILKLDDGTTKIRHTTKRQRIVYMARGLGWQEADLTVFYEVSSDRWDKPHSTFNRGVFTNCDDLLTALRQFSEADLVDWLVSVAQ